jgi:tetratricopeptide (TPR) repeat protein
MMYLCALLSLFVVFPVFPVNAAPSGERVLRQEPVVGVIAGVQGDAEIRMVAAEQWQTAVRQQDLASGDGLRTGAYGTMALLFNDHTQIQVQRRSILMVKSVAADSRSGTSVFRLQRGGTWSRAATGGSGVRIETPSATAAIRGTDWSLMVDEHGSSRLVVLDGEVQFENALGSVSVRRGEVGFAEIGKAPSKTILTHPDDRNEQIYNFSLVDMLKYMQLTQLNKSELAQARTAIEAIAGAQRTPGQWLDLAEMAYDMNDGEAVRHALAAVTATDPRIRSRQQLIQGFQALSGADFAKAYSLLSTAEPGLDAARRLSARIAEVGSLFLLHRTTEAESLLARLKARYGTEGRYLLFSATLTAFAGDMTGALEQLRQDGKAFPDMADFAALESGFALLLDRPDEARQSARRALEIDPGSSMARQILGSYLQNYRGDSEGAVEVLRQGLAFNDRDNTLWGGLALVYYQMGELRMAEDAYLRALELNPRGVAELCNYALLLLDQSRLTEAEKLLQRLEAIDPGRDIVLKLRGRLGMQRNRLDLAREDLLKAATISPTMSDTAGLLAQDYYQQGELALAQQTIDNADRLDPNEPLIPLVAATIAADRAYADQAIEYARKAIKRYRKLGGVGVTGLAASRGGNTNLGAAFLNLGLNNWGDNYSELSYDPYAAESHTFRAVQGKGGTSSLYQALLLDPLAASSRNRFIDFYRRPFTDTELGASAGWPASGSSYGGNATVQGFLLSPRPTSYYLSVSHADTARDRENNDQRQTAFSTVVGTNITPYDHLFVDIVAGNTGNGYPGYSVSPDLDDSGEGRLLSGGIGYSHTFSARNRVMARIMGLSSEKEYSNADALGTTELSALDYSLIRNFGLEDSRLLYELGLTPTNSPGGQEAPTIHVGGSSGSLSSTLPASLDVNPVIRADVKEDSLTITLRHLLTVGSFDLSYGAELMPFRWKTLVDSFQPGGEGAGTGQLVGQGNSLPFVYGSPVFTSVEGIQDGLAANAHLNGLWRITDSLQLESGLFLASLDDDLGSTRTRLDPRIGLAWEVDEGDWLRLVLRNEMILPLPYTLAPVATVGLVADIAPVAIGGRSRIYAARWDREWNKRLFTTLELRRQDIEGFSMSIADSRDSLSAARGRIDQASLTVNLWIEGGLGLFGSATINDSEDRSDGGESGQDLALIPDQRYRAGLTWIHPAQIRLTLSTEYVGQRWPGASGLEMLDNYQTVDFTASWQPLDRHLELGLSAANLLDEDYEVASGMPGAGRLLSATAKWRF